MAAREARRRTWRYANSELLRLVQPQAFLNEVELQDERNRFHACHDTLGYCACVARPDGRHTISGATANFWYDVHTLDFDGNTFSGHMVTWCHMMSRGLSRWHVMAP